MESSDRFPSVVLDFMVQMENVEGEAEQQPFSSNLHIAPKQKTPEIKILLHVCKVAFGRMERFT